MDREIRDLGLQDPGPVNAGNRAKEEEEAAAAAAAIGAAEEAVARWRYYWSC